MGSAKTPLSASTEIVGLVDGHCFYVSAHRLFEPKLLGRPVVVLSNNDGAVVSRSDEAKALGVKMSQPAFQLRHLVQREGLILRSSNYPLYQDMHRRMMLAVQSCGIDIDVYSVDECFIRLTGMPGGPAGIEAMGRQIQSTVLRKTGLPTGVGISRTKTTAKLCNWASKKWKAKTGSVVSLLDRDRLDKLLDYADVGEVWGIGRASKKRLNDVGITSAGELCRAEISMIRRELGSHGVKTLQELRWHSCYGFGEVAGPKQMLASTRSFSTRVTDLPTLATAVATHAAKLSAKLRAQKSLACAVRVFIQTSEFATIEKKHSKSALSVFARPTSDTREITETVILLLHEIYRDGVEWAKCGVLVTETIGEIGNIADIFAPPVRPKSAELMATIDRINKLSGVGTVRFGRESADRHLGVKREHGKARPTTCWSELITVKI